MATSQYIMDATAAMMLQNTGMNTFSDVPIMTRKEEPRRTLSESVSAGQAESVSVDSFELRTPSVPITLHINPLGESPANAAYRPSEATETPEAAEPLHIPTEGIDYADDSHMGEEFGGEEDHGHEHERDPKQAGNATNGRHGSVSVRPAEIQSLDSHIRCYRALLSLLDRKEYADVLHPAVEVYFPLPVFRNALVAAIPKSRELKSGMVKILFEKRKPRQITNERGKEVMLRDPLDLEFVRKLHRAIPSKLQTLSLALLISELQTCLADNVDIMEAAFEKNTDIFLLQGIVQIFRTKEHCMLKELAKRVEVTDYVKVRMKEQKKQPATTSPSSAENGNVGGKPITVREMSSWMHIIVKELFSVAGVGSVRAATHSTTNHTNSNHSNSQTESSLTPPLTSPAPLFTTASASEHLTQRHHQAQAQAEAAAERPQQQAFHRTPSPSLPDDAGPYHEEGKEGMEVPWHGLVVDETSPEYPASLSPEGKTEEEEHKAVTGNADDDGVQNNQSEREQVTSEQKEENENENDEDREEKEVPLKEESGEEDTIPEAPASPHPGLDTRQQSVQHGRARVGQKHIVEEVMRRARSQDTVRTTDVEHGPSQFVRMTTPPPPDPASGHAAPLPQSLGLQEEGHRWMQRLIWEKPWLDEKSIKSRPIVDLQRRYTLEWMVEERSTESPLSPTSAAAEHTRLHNSTDRQKELSYIATVVKKKLELPREGKSDLELRDDARYYGKFGDFLVDRFEKRDYYERLGITCNATAQEIKKAYRGLALHWHPDNMKKTYRYYFAHEENFRLLLTDIFRLCDEAYKTLGNSDLKSVYDAKLTQERRLNERQEKYKNQMATGMGGVTRGGRQAPRAFYRYGPRK